MTPPCYRAKICKRGQFCLQGGVRYIWWPLAGKDQQRHSISQNAQDSPKERLSSRKCHGIAGEKLCCTKKSKPQLEKGKGPELHWWLLCLQEQKEEEEIMSQRGDQTSLLFSQSRASSGLLYSKQREAWSQS